MRIAITSDIHFHLPWIDAIRAFADHLAQQSPDMFIVAGDMGEPIDMFMQGLEMFAPVSERRAAVAGNHDVWHRTGAYSSKYLWERLLQLAAVSNEYAWLERYNIRLNGLGICGTIGWYDYSAKPEHLRLTNRQYAEIKPMLSNDGNYIDWEWSDRDFAAKVHQSFEKRLDQLENDPAVKDILVVTHVPLFRECLRETPSRDHEVLNAFYANIPLGETVLQRSKVRAIVSGHVHRDRHLELRRDQLDMQPVQVHTIPSDYGAPAGLMLDTDTWVINKLNPVQVQQR